MIGLFASQGRIGEQQRNGFACRWHQISARCSRCQFLLIGARASWARLGFSVIFTKVRWWNVLPLIVILLIAVIPVVDVRLWRAEVISWRRLRHRGAIGGWRMWWFEVRNRFVNQIL